MVRYTYVNGKRVPVQEMPKEEPKTGSSAFAVDTAGAMDAINGIFEKIVDLIKKGGLSLFGAVMIVLAVLKPDSFKWMTDSSKLKSVITIVKGGWDYLQPVWVKLFNLEHEENDNVDQIFDIVQSLVGSTPVSEALSGLSLKRF